MVSATKLEIICYSGNRQLIHRDLTLALERLANTSLLAAALAEHLPSA